MIREERRRCLRKIDDEIYDTIKLINSLERKLDRLISSGRRYLLVDGVMFDRAQLRQLLYDAEVRYRYLCTLKESIIRSRIDDNHVNRKVAHLTVVYEEDLDFEKILNYGIRGISI